MTRPLLALCLMTALSGCAPEADGSSAPAAVAGPSSASPAIAYSGFKTSTRAPMRGSPAESETLPSSLSGSAGWWEASCAETLSAASRTVSIAIQDHVALVHGEVHIFERDDIGAEGLFDVGRNGDRRNWVAEGYT